MMYGLGRNIRRVRVGNRIDGGSHELSMLYVWFPSLELVPDFGCLNLWMPVIPARYELAIS